MSTIACMALLPWWTMQTHKNGKIVRGQQKWNGVIESGRWNLFWKMVGGSSKVVGGGGKDMGKITKM